jgi:hypothetical protein
MDKITSYTVGALMTVSLTAAPTYFNTAHASAKAFKSFKRTSVAAPIKKFRYKARVATPTGGGGCQTLSADTLEAKASPFRQTINQAAQKYGVSTSLIKSVITIESCFKPTARGSSGEKGLMQLMPGTARRFNIKNGYSAQQNIHGGTKYLSLLLDRYNGNTHRAVAAYNAGEGNVGLSGRIPNSYYVGKVMHAYSKFSKGKSQARFARYDAVKAEPTHLAVGAIFTPVNDGKPANKRIRTKQALFKAQGAERNWPWGQRKTRSQQQGVYQVRTGDTLYGVMQETGIPVKKLMRLNGLKSVDNLSVGQVLRLPKGRG